MLDQATLLALLRGVHLAATLSLLGMIGFLAWMLPAAGSSADAMRTPLIRMWRISGAAGLLVGAAWFVLQSAAIADASTWQDMTAALPVVAGHTRYGNVMVVRAGLLLLATLLAGTSRIRMYPALVLVAVALGLQGLIGHAGAMGGRIGDGIVASEALHLLAAGLWFGALVPLWSSVGRLPPAAGHAVCERFSPLGLGCVLVIAGTGLTQAVALIGSVAALFGTEYGHIALLKIALFLLALGLAALNRLWLTDRLTQADTWGRSGLRFSIVCETLTGLAIILAAGLLGSSVPAEHEQPVWPFSWRFSLAAVNEDPALREEVIVSLILIGLATALVAAAWRWRWFRIIALVVLATIIVLRGPELKLLTVEAYPTSFQTSPTGFSAASIVRGQALFGQNCVACHGSEADGSGPLAGQLRIKPADLTQPHLWVHADGELFWWLTHGIDEPEGGLAMPGFPQLPATDRWALIDYIRAHNAGLAMQRDVNFDIPVAAPALPLRCTGSAAARTADLRGDVVHVLADGTPEALAPIPPQLGVPIVTLELQRDDTAAGAPPSGTCVATNAAAWPAFAVLADVAPDKLAGSEFLIDRNGWLRAVRVAGRPSGWPTRNDLIAAVRGICANPLQPTSGGEHEHH